MPVRPDNGNGGVDRFKAERRNRQNATWNFSSDVEDDDEPEQQQQQQQRQWCSI